MFCGCGRKKKKKKDGKDDEDNKPVDDFYYKKIAQVSQTSTQTNGTEKKDLVMLVNFFLGAGLYHGCFCF